MSSIENSTDLSLLFHSLRERLSRYLPESSERAQIIFDSSALLQVSNATIKNIPYAFLAKEMGLNDVSHMLSSRITYLEGALLTAVSTISNLFFALFYTGLSVATLGLSSSMNFGMRKHWHHVTYGAAATSVAALGVITPYYGAGLNVMLLLGSYNMLKECYGHDVHLFERPLLREIQEITRNYSPIIYNYTREKLKDDFRYQSEYKPSLDYIDGKIQSAKEMNDLVELIMKVRDQWPKIEIHDSSPATQTRKKTRSKAVHKHYE